MVFIGYGTNDNRLRVRKKVEWLACHSDLKHLHRRLVPVMVNFLSLSNDKDFVIVSDVIPIHPSGKQEWIKTMSVLTRLPHSLGP